MEAHVQIATAAKAGPPPEASRRLRLKRTLPMALAALVLVPSVLFAAPLKAAFDNLLVATENKVALDGQPLGEDGSLLRRAASHRGPAGGEGGGVAPGRPLVLVAARRSTHDGLLKLADFQSTMASQGADTVLGDDASDGDLMTATHRAAADMASVSSDIGPAQIRAASGRGGGFGSGLGGGDGGIGAQAGRPGGAPDAAGAAGPGGSTAGLGDDGAAGLSPLGSGLSTLSAAPEPAAWVSLILGFGLTGAVLRRRRRDARPAAQR